MQTVAYLQAEHRWIMLLLDCLDRIVVRTELHGRPPIDASRELFHLLQSFVDAEHQEKEERFLFRTMLARGDAAQSAYLLQLYEEHRKERYDLDLLTAYLRGSLGREETCVKEFLARARAYARDQRRHLAHENAILLPLAERILRPDDDEAILEAFRRVGSRRSEIAARVNEVCEMLEVSPEPIDSVDVV